MKLVLFKRFYLITDSQQFDKTLADAICLAKKNTKLSFRLICVLNGNRKLSQIIQKNIPDNLQLVRYACNRDFDLGYALINYLLKNQIKHMIVINNLSIEQLTRLKLIKSEATTVVNLTKGTSALVINRGKFCNQFKLSISVLNTINSFLKNDVTNEGL